jgi:hypothetical protein
MRRGRFYETSLDRAGLAIGVGGALVGVVTVALVLMAGQRDPVALAGAWLLGSIFGVIGVTAVAGPLWLALHLAGHRGPVHAAILGLLLALVVFVAGQTYGFGLFDMPPTDSRTLLVRWLSALATSALIALVAAGIGVAMWRIAYRRVA